MSQTTSRMQRGCEPYKNTGLCHSKEMWYQHPHRLLCSCQEGMAFCQIRFPESFAQYLPSNHYFISVIKKNYQVQSFSLKKRKYNPFAYFNKVNNLKSLGNLKKISTLFYLRMPRLLVPLALWVEGFPVC